METNENGKIELPVAPSTEIMGLLIKAKHFFVHASQHAKSENFFDTMIAIHSLDNSIEYLLRIIIKHLEIEEQLGKTLSTPELMALFGEVDKFLKEKTLFNGRGCGLPYENEIRQLRGLRNNVQHGIILPLSELENFVKYGDNFFEKVLSKIFGLTIQQISYSTLIENETIKSYLIDAENRISEKKFLEAIVACRDAFEYGQFILQDRSHHIRKMAAIPHIKQQSIDLYYYIQSIDEEISVLGSGVSMADYKLYSRYNDHIPGEYRAIKSGYSVMQRDWEEKDAEFCYSFVAQTILTWQLSQERPLYKVDMSMYPVHENERYINGVLLSEMYDEKSCHYLADDVEGFLTYIDRDEIKEHIRKIPIGSTCRFRTRILKKGADAIFRDYTEYVIMNAHEFNLVLNKGPLWELMLYYKRIPFTVKTDLDDEIDIDNIKEYAVQNEREEEIKNIIIDFGQVNSIKKAYELDEILISKDVYSIFSKGLISSNLISLLEKEVQEMIQ